jgi:hypothetical protein
VGVFYPLFVASDGFFTSRRVQLANLAVRHAIPAAFSTRDFTEAGGLMSYGTRLTDAWRQVRRARATIAFFIPRCLAIFIAQALSQDHFAERTSILWAAS